MTTNKAEKVTTAMLIKGFFTITAIISYIASRIRCQSLRFIILRFGRSRERERERSRRNYPGHRWR